MFCAAAYDCLAEDSLLSYWFFKVSVSSDNIGTMSFTSGFEVRSCSYLIKMHVSFLSVKKTQSSFAKASSYRPKTAQPLSSKSVSSTLAPTLSTRKLPFNETKHRRKQTDKQMELTVKKISTNIVGRRNKAYRHNYNCTREIPEVQDWQVEYKTRQGGAHVYNPNAPSFYDATKFDETSRAGGGGFSRIQGPMLARHRLKKYKHFPDHPIAKYLKGKGKKYYDIEDESNVKPIEIRLYKKSRAY
jgi:hypothetical protein